MTRTLILLLIALSTIACAPGEIERRLTTAVAMSCFAVNIQRVICDPVHDNIQNCHMETVPVPCEPQTDIIAVCIPAPKEDTP